jgi:phosphoglycerate kinase
MPVKTVKDIDLKNKRVIARVDFNVPIKEGKITDDTRIQAALPTIRYVLDQKGASLILMSHLGRPKGSPDPAFSLKPVAEHLGKLLNTRVVMAGDCVGPEVEKQAKNLEPGDVMLLENTRFHDEEKKNGPEFSKKLASLADVYVNDAFGSAHRAHASTEGITKHLPSVAGFLLEKEIKFFEPLLKRPKRPFVAIIGGAKVSTKIGVLENLIPKCDTLIIGGGMAYTFLKAEDHEIGNSLFEDEYLETAKKLLKSAKEKNVSVILPTDHLVADKFDENAEAEKVDTIDVPAGKVAMDIGEKTLKAIRTPIEHAQSLIWNGPMGVFEFDKFANGTLEVAKMVAACKGMTVIGGGDSVAAVNKFNLADKIDHVSTGGGASLELLEGKTLPGIAALES